MITMMLVMLMMMMTMLTILWSLSIIYQQNLMIAVIVMMTMTSLNLIPEGTLPCYVFCICLLTTNKYQKYKSVEMGNELIPEGTGE